MRQLFPIERDDVDPLACYGAPDRPRSPWVIVNMITTIDGATAVDGRSGRLGGPADKRVFAAVRATADVILVGAGTARAENYGPPVVPARLAIVSARLDLDPGARVFSGDQRPVVVTIANADPARRAAIEDVAEVIEAGQDRVDLGRALEHFEGVVVCEGGPSLNGQLVAAGLVDELCLSLAPLLASGESSRVAHGPEPQTPHALELAHVLEEDGYLFLRYARS